MGNDDTRRERRFSLWGWILFVVCALFFIASSLQGRDLFGLFGSMIFLAACFVFLYPLVKKDDRDQGK
jgi:hypothetical protein